ncbi:MAG: FliM/FliN family flagellar motor switch protein [Bryobacteraceae bacterium]
MEQVGHLADISIALEIELGRKTMTVRQILGLDAGSVVVLPRSAGENVDLMIDGFLIGCGEIVIIEDAMGIRVTDFRADE